MPLMVTRSSEKPSNREIKHHYHHWDFFRGELLLGKRWAAGRGAPHDSFTNWRASVGGGQAQMSLGLGHNADIGCASDGGPLTVRIRWRGGPLGLVVPGTLARARRTLAKVQLQEEGAGGEGLGGGGGESRPWNYPGETWTLSLCQLLGVPLTGDLRRSESDAGEDPLALWFLAHWRGEEDPGEGAASGGGSRWWRTSWRWR